MPRLRRFGAASAALGGALPLIPAAARAQGMPQLDFGNPLTISQVVWGAVIFFALYLLLWRWALPKVAVVLQERAHGIAADLEAARGAKATADAAVAELTAATARARSEAQGAINAASEQAKQQAAAQAETLNERLEARLKSAEAQIGQARAAALGALRQVATETAATVVARLTGAAPDSARLDGAIGTALAARGQG